MINKKKCRFSQIILGELTYFLEEEIKWETLVLHGWSMYWQPVVLHAVSEKAGGQLFSVLLDCTLENELEL